MRHGKILEEKQTGLPGNDDVQIAVSIDVRHRDLHPPSCPGTVVDEVFYPLKTAIDWEIFVPVHT